MEKIISYTENLNIGWAEIVTVFFLAWNAWKDWKQKEISLVLTGIYAMAGVGISLLERREIVDWILPLGMGGMILGLAFLTRGAIGYGDGWLLLALAGFLSAGIYVRMTVTGLFLAAVWSMILMLFCKKNRKTEIPLVPFLLAGYLGGLLW